MTQSVVVKDKKAGTAIRKSHIATFNGNHNAVRAKTLILLYDEKYYFRRNTGISCATLIRLTGANEGYLKNKIRLWCDWHYLIKLVNNGPGRNYFMYRIAARGKKFVEERIPKNKLMEYRRELKDIYKGYNY